MSRRARLLIGLSLGLPVVALALTLLVLPRIDLAQVAADRATAALGRAVTIESLRLSPGLTIGIALRGARLANIEGGTRPEMAVLDRLDATIDLLPLLHGEVVLRGARAEGFVLHLERAPGRRANWRFAGAPAAPAAPPDRRALPMVHDLTLVRSEIVFRTTGGAELRTAIDHAALVATASDQPASLTAEGSYNAVPLRVEATLGAFRQLRDPATPFPMTLRATAAETALLFEGTATDPLNVDGLSGRLDFAASTPQAVLAMAGVAEGPAMPVEFTAAATRQGDLWRLTDLAGTLDGADIAASLLELTEGDAGNADAIVARLAFAQLDLDRLLEARPPGAMDAPADPAFAVPADPDPRIQAEISARSFSHSWLSGEDAEVTMEIASGRVALDARFAPSIGGRAAFAGEMVPEGDGARATGRVELRGTDLDALRRKLGLHALPVAGPLDMDMTFAAEGRTLGAATAGARISAVLRMSEGSIAREVIEMASTDIRALFRTHRGRTRIACLLAAVDIQGGRGEAAPLRIRAGTGTIAGLATFDLNRRVLDLVIGSERATTDFFALDIPVHVRGSFADPAIGPAEWSREGRARLQRGAMAPLPPELMALARANPCYTGRSLRR